MSEVSKLGYRFDLKKSLGRQFELLIDSRPLLDILEDAFVNLSNESKWREKSDCKMSTKELKKSYKKQGVFSLLTCAHCEMPEDILLRNFQIIHIEEYVIWNVKPPGADVYFEEYGDLTFKFHKPQYQKTINNLIDEKMMSN